MLIRTHLLLDWAPCYWSGGLTGPDALQTDCRTEFSRLVVTRAVALVPKYNGWKVNLAVALVPKYNGLKTFSLVWTPEESP